MVGFEFEVMGIGTPEFAQVRGVALLTNNSLFTMEGPYLTGKPAVSGKHFGRVTPSRGRVSFVP
jgi:hypothetical protein